MGRSLWLIIAVVVAAAAQAMIYPLLNAAGLGQDMAARSAPVTTPATPASWAFAIWGLIYLSTFAYAVWQALRAQRRNPILEVTRVPALLAFTFNTAWVIWVQLSGIDWISLVLILAGLAANLTIMMRLARLTMPTFSRDGLLIKAPLGLLAGWATVAAAANAAAVSAAYDLHPLTLTLELQSAILIGLAGLVAAFIALRSRGAALYAAAAAWGLAAVIVRNQAPQGSQLVMLVAAAAILVVVTALVAGWRRKA